MESYALNDKVFNKNWVIIIYIDEESNAGFWDASRGNQNVSFGQGVPETFG